MDKFAVWKWLILVALVSISVALITPPKEKIKLGLDLKGGTSFTVELDEERIRNEIRARSPDLTEQQIDAEVAAILEGSQARTLEVMRNRIDNLGIAEPVIYPVKGNRIVIQLPGVDEKQRQKAERSIESVAFLEFRMVHENNDELVEKLFEKKLAPEGYKIATGVPGNFYLEDRKFPDTARDEAYRERLGRFQIPDASYEFMLEKMVVDRQTVYRPYFVKRRRELSGESLKDASVDYQAMGQPVVKLRFDAKGAKRFASVTSDYAPGGARNPDRTKYRQLAIVLDGTLYSAPRIIEPIYGGKAEISGSFTPQEAIFLANILRAGSLPAPVKIVERRVVDPTLGEDSIRSGVTAGLYGCMVVVVLMAIYYLVPGLLADLALFLNVILLPLGMVVVAGFLDIFSGTRTGGSVVQLPVLTLPGIAGIALTIGMAVDANVLIFERIREEMRAGKSFMGSIQAGYERAFTAIFDSNITTIITAVILFVLGAGPVRGYAVTLTAGLLVNLYTAVVVTRMCFNAIGARSGNMKWLRMLQLFKESNIDFIRWWKTMLSISVLIIVVSWTLMIMHGLNNPRSVFSVDFTGGSTVTLSFTQKPDVEIIRSVLASAGVHDVGIQYQRAMKAGEQEVLQIKVGSASEGMSAAKIISEKLPEAGFKVLQEDDVGPQVGSELKRKASWAMFWSLVAMIIYIAWRFEFGFALGAVVALFHDVLVTAGVCHLLGFQISLPVLAALMTIIGYSVNDTIVIFDRIRENLRLIRNRSFLDICNLSINQTLSRTLLTSFLTLVSVVCLVVFGGGAIRDFSVAMLVGMLAGTYSTMYIATPVVLLWYRFKTPDLGAKAAK